MTLDKKETVLENRFVRYVCKLGYDCIKMHRRGMPDRLISLTNGYHFYIEFKRKGEEPTKLQIYTHDCLRNSGHHVYVCDVFEDAKAILEYEIAWHEAMNDEFVDYRYYRKMEDENEIQAT